MKFTFRKSEFQRAIGRVHAIAEKRGTLPILSNILIESVGADALCVTGTNLEMFMKDTCPAVVERGGSICVSASTLNRMVGSLPESDEVVLVLEDTTVRINAGSLRYGLPSIDSSDFPAMPPFEGVDMLRVETGVLRHLLNHTLFAAADSDPRLFLNGVNIEKAGDSGLRMVSTDGHRLALVERPLESPFILDKALILPKKGAIEIRKLIKDGEGHCFLGFHENNAFFRYHGSTVVIRLIQGVFPDYNIVIPKIMQKAVTIQRDQFLETIRRITVTSETRVATVRLRFEPGRLTVSSSNPEIGDASDTIEIDGFQDEPFDIGFNAAYFIDLLSNIDDREIQLHFNDQVSPCLIRRCRPEPGEQFLCVIMPMRA